MVLALYERMMRAKRNDRAANAARELRRRFGESHLPTGEAPFKIKGFLRKDEMSLRKKDFQIFTLTGQSIKSIRSTYDYDPGDLLRVDSYIVDRNLIEDLSQFSEVAIDPSQLYLPDSNNLSLAEQKKIILKHSKTLQTNLQTNDVEAVMLEAPDYIDLFYSVPKEVREMLFGKLNEYRSARTPTKVRLIDTLPESYTEVASVGQYNGEGLHVSHTTADKGYPHLFAFPVIVPFRSVSKTL